MAPQLDGRVFSRLQQFAALHEEFQEEVKALEVYLTTHQTDVFGLHHANLVKTVRSVRAKPLIDTIDTWLLNKNAPVVAPVDETSLPAAEDEATPVVATAATTDETAPVPAPTTEQVPATELALATEQTAATEHVPAAVEAAPVVPTTEDAAVTRRAHAAKLLEGLVLHGFLTPYKEHEKMPTTPTTDTTPAPLHFKDSELFVPLAPEVNDAKTLNVWHLVDGAVFAGVLKRKAGFLAPLTQGKDVYAVVNQRLNSLTLFETDVGREPIVHFEASVTPAVDGAEPSTAKVHVSFDKSHFVHGIKIWNDVTTELLNAATKLEREVIVHALVGAGLQYREDLTINPENIKSIYELKDASIDSDEIVFDKYKGKVLLIVNVSSACGLTPVNYPELVALDTKYRDQGLEILAFPCNQFGGQEPGSHEEIKAFVAQYNVTFQLFEKGDVNGTETRPVFAYLKAKQPGIGGDYIKWNFTKFLVDRNGQPVQRYAPTVTPLSFEDEIVKLLSAQAELDVVSLSSETTEATTEKETEATALPATEETPATIVAPIVPVEDIPVPAPAPVDLVPAPAPAPVEDVPAPTPAPVEVAPPVPVSPPSLEFVEPKEPETTTTTTTTTTEVVTVDKIVDALTKSEVTSVPVTTLSMDKLPLPVEQELPAVPETAPVVVEEEPAPETKVEVDAKSPVADATGEEMAEPATPVSCSSVPVTKTPAGQVVQGFTPGNEPAALAAPAP